MKAEYYAGLPVPVPFNQIENHIKEKKSSEIPPEDNMIVVTWFDDPESLSKEQDVSTINSHCNK